MCVGRMISSKLDPVSVRDKQNPGGPRRVSHVSREVIVTESEPIVITRWLKDTEKPEDWKPSAPKGSPVVVTITGMETNQGIVVLAGTIAPLEMEGKKP